MKLLLDEQVPRNLRRLFPEEFTVETVQSMGWSQTSNGALLALAASEEFDALITADRNMEYQQNQEELPISVVVLVAFSNRFSDLAPLIPSALDELRGLSSPVFFRVDE